MSKIFEVSKGNLMDHDFSPCISLVNWKRENTICPDDPYVGPYFVQASVSCFKKGSEQEVITTMLMHTECSASALDISVQTQSGVRLYR
jgi:hypothetical protein